MARIPKVIDRGKYIGYDAGAGVRKLFDKLIDIDTQRRAEERQAEMDELDKEKAARQAEAFEFDKAMKGVEAAEMLLRMTPEEEEVIPAKTQVVTQKQFDPVTGKMLSQEQIPLQIEEQRIKKPMATPPTPIYIPGIGEYTPRTRSQQIAAEEEERKRELEAKKDMLPTLEESIGIMTGEGDPETAVPPALQQALGWQYRPTTRGRENKTVRGVGLVERQDDGTWKTVVAEKAPVPEPKKKEPLTPAVIQKMARVPVMAQRVFDLAKMPSKPILEAVGWVPHIVTNMVAEDGSALSETEAGKLAQKYLSYQPAYFLFAAEMLKATQGSRPSDKDMEWYLENLPRVDDNEETKTKKIARLQQQLLGTFNSEVTFLKKGGYDVPFDTVHVPQEWEIMDAVRGLEKAPLDAPGDDMLNTGDVKSGLLEKYGGQ